MNQETITLKEALQIFNRRDKLGQLVPFDISFRTFSKTTKTGGTLKVFENVKYLPPANPDAHILDTIFNVLDPIKAAKDPKHFENYTRNIELADGQIRKHHVYFIITVNEFKVIY